MKKAIAFLLSALLLCAAAGCASESKEKASSQTDAVSNTETTDAPSPEATAVTAAAALSPALEEAIQSHNLEGVVYAVQDGTAVASYAKGKTENGSDITLDTPLPLGSVSKQFCAAAVLLLQDQGKLSVNDTLDKFYPDYAEGKRLTLHNLLSMRSGIPELTEESGAAVSPDKSEAENVAAIKQWVFSQPLLSDPDKEFVYTNINYFLLADIVEQASGKPYAEFLRESFFTPLGMTHTGSVSELAGSPARAQGNTYEKVESAPGLTKGAGDLIANAADVTAWINALSGGKAISAECYRAMTTDYSPGTHYGYGMYLDLHGGVGHYGAIQIYSAFDYVNTDKKLTLVALSNSIDPTLMTGVADDLLTALLP